MSVNWQLEEAKQMLRDSKDELEKVRAENASMSAELSMLRRLYEEIFEELRQLDGKNDIRNEILYGDMNESLATFADDVVDRVARNAEAREAQKLFTTEVKRATMEMDSGVGSELRTSTPVKTKSFTFEAGKTDSEKGSTEDKKKA